MEGNYDYFFKPFDSSCHQLAPKTAKLVKNLTQHKIISVVFEKQFTYEFEFGNMGELLTYFESVFPDKKDQMREAYPKIMKQHNYSFPLLLKEDSLFEIVKGVSNV